MKHPLFVGHLDVSVRSLRPKVMKPIDIDRVVAILAKYCDKEPNGSPVIVENVQDALLAESQWLGRIGQEDVLFKAGYLICPWLGVAVNRGSVSFIYELHDTLGIQIFEPGDSVHVSPQQLADAVRDFDEIG